MDSPLVWMLLPIPVWGVLVVLTSRSAYRNGLCDGYAAFREPRDPLYRSQRETVRMWLGHRFTELLTEKEPR